MAQSVKIRPVVTITVCVDIYLNSNFDSRYVLPKRRLEAVLVLMNISGVIAFRLDFVVNLYEDSSFHTYARLGAVFYEDFSAYDLWEVCSLGGDFLSHPFKSAFLALSAIVLARGWTLVSHALLVELARLYSLPHTAVIAMMMTVVPLFHIFLVCALYHRFPAFGECLAFERSAFCCHEPLLRVVSGENK